MAEITQRSVGLMSAGQVKKVKMHLPHCTLQLVRRNTRTCGCFIDKFKHLNVNLFRLFKLIN